MKWKNGKGREGDRGKQNELIYCHMDNKWDAKSSLKDDKSNSRSLSKEKKKLRAYKSINK